MSHSHPTLSLSHLLPIPPNPDPIHYPLQAVLIPSCPPPPMPSTFCTVPMPSLSPSHPHPIPSSSYPLLIPSHSHPNLSPLHPILTTSPLHPIPHSPHPIPHLPYPMLFPSYPDPSAVLPCLTCCLDSHQTLSPPYPTLSPCLDPILPCSLPEGAGPAAPPHHTSACSWAGCLIPFACGHLRAGGG